MSSLKKKKQQNSGDFNILISACKVTKNSSWILAPITLSAALLYWDCDSLIKTHSSTVILCHERADSFAVTQVSPRRVRKQSHPFQFSSRHSRPWLQASWAQRTQAPPPRWILSHWHHQWQPNTPPVQKQFISELSDSSGPSVIRGESRKNPSRRDAASFRVISGHQVLIPFVPSIQKGVWEDIQHKRASAEGLHAHIHVSSHQSMHKTLNHALCLTDKGTERIHHIATHGSEWTIFCNLNKQCLTPQTPTQSFYLIWIRAATESSACK